jgi:glycosyltransferase involved in cell wall biosynthesis
MRVAYDPIIFLAQKYGGISRYIVEVANFLSHQTNLKIFVVAPFYVNEYVKATRSFTLLGFEVKNLSWMPFTLSNKLLNNFFNVFTILIGDLILRCIRPQIIHESYYFPYALGPKRAKRVLTIHDMIHEKYPAYFPKNNRIAKFKSLAAIRADHIICNSESTKKDVLELLKVSPERVSVIYLGFSNFPRLTIEPSICDRPERKFLLFVGMRDGYKNFSGFLDAYSQSETLRSEFVIACFGGNQFSDTEYKLMKTLGIDREKVKHYGGDDDRLHWFYQNASAFVYPSLYEGFGMPPLEAMSNGCPVVCSKSSSIPEVVGNAGEYFDPTIPADISLAIEKVVFDANRSADLIGKGAERIKHFSWERCALETQAVYEALFKPPLSGG